MRLLTVLLLPVLGWGQETRAIDGPWVGTVDFEPQKLRIVLRFRTGANGLTATLDSPDQAAGGIPATVQRTGAGITVEIPAIAARFEGTLATEGESISGAYTQLGTPHDLVLRRVKDEAELKPRRPQTPVPPFPYRVEEVKYRSADGVQLAGTVTIPAGEGPFPAIVLASGSGPQDRDEPVGLHRPFWVLADFLTRRGFAVLRTDDRGTGESEGNYDTSSTVEFADDVEAGVRFLKARPDVSKVGIAGHSEGGYLAAVVAGRNKDVAFLVLMAAPGVPGDRIILSQQQLMLQASGASREVVERNDRRTRQVLKAVIEIDDVAARRRAVREAFATVPEGEVERNVDIATTPWYRTIVLAQPGPALRKVTVPVLAIGGSKDLQVHSGENLAAIREALKENKDAIAVELPGLNHMLQTAVSGMPAEYAQIDETISPAALRMIGDWLERRK